MKKIHKLSLIIVLLITFSFIRNTYALDDGWYEENGEKYYYKDGEKLEGFQTVEDKRYFFGIGTKRLLHGWQNYEGKFYADPETGEIKQGWQHIGEEDYYIKDDHTLEGFQTIEDKRYFFGIGSNRLLHGWQNYEGKFYADPETGEIKSGWQHIGVEDYYIKDDHTLEGFQTIDGKRCFFGIGSNRLLHGWQNYEGKFYADPETGEIKQGWQHIGTEDYYIDGYHTLEGFQTIEGKRYFFGIGSNRLLHGWQNYEGKFYADPETGEIKQGWQHIGTEDYYIDGYHTVEGLQTIENKRYFFGIGSNRLLHGWQYYDNKIFYGSLETGELLTGLHTINSRDYKFNEENGLLDGFKYENGKMYYYDPDGTLNKGIQYIADRHWKFNEITGAFEKYVRQIRVIDISQHNGEINWDQVKASGKVDAVILRLGFGSYSYDTRFDTNKAELERLGIPYSIYLFSYAEREDQAYEEAQFVINSVRNKNINIATNIFGIYYDLEYWKINSTGQTSNTISQDSYKKIITRFVDDVERNLCIKARVYASKNYIETRFPSEVQHYATWVAQWGDSITYGGAWEGWQFTSKADIPGIPWGYDEYGNYGPHTDMSIFYY